jgi:hypothetical protein
MIKKSIAILRQKDIFLPTLFIYSFLAIEAWIYVWFQTQYIWVLGMDKAHLWIWISVAVVFSLLFTHFLPKQKWVLNKWFFIFIALCFIIPLFMNVYYPSLVALCLLYLAQIIRPMDIPLEDKILNSITDNTWSTVLSFVGFYERILFMIITIFISVLNYPVFIVLWITSIIMLLLIILDRFTISHQK